MLEGATIRTRFALGAVALFVVTLSACTAAPASAPPSAPSSTKLAEAEPTPDPVKTAEVPQEEALSLTELHEKYSASGLQCEWAISENVPLGAIETGVCLNSENGISRFASQADVDALLQLNANSTMESGIFLVGDRWVVGSEHPEDLITAQRSMGGELWPADSPFFATT